MAFLWRSTSLMLASLILLYWATSSASSVELLPDSRDRADRVLNTVKDSLSLFKDVMEQIDTNKLTGMMKGLANFASVAPGVGAVVSSVINMVLIFIPQEDPVLKEVKEGFAEVNRKLDSLSIQIANLATHVEWFNYASVYSQDEVRILNAWRKFDEFFNKNNSNDFNHLAEIFTNYYEYTQAEASVANLYHYLTVSDTALSGNLNSLLKKKFKCGIGEITKYNLYFSSLLWKGMVLNEVYWKLIGFNSSGKEAEHAEMFKNVYAAQWEAVESCLNEYERYMKEDVEEVAKALSPDNKQVIATQVKKFLDAKYSWYNWVVLVYDTTQDGNHILYNPVKITAGKLTVAVYHVQQAEEIDLPAVRETADTCFKDQPCHLQFRLQTCRHSWSNPNWGGDSFPVSITFLKYAIVTHAASNDDLKEAPQPFHRLQCYWGNSVSKVSVHYSRKLPTCELKPCRNNGRCRALADSNQWLCGCQDGYYGDMCEKKINTSMSQELKTLSPLVTSSTTHGKLKAIESKLDRLLSQCQRF